MNRLALSLGLLFTLALTIVLSCQLTQAKPNNNVTAYLVQFPSERPATQLVALNGEFKPSQYTQILAENSGKITKIFVQDGDYVRQGEPLLEFDATLAKLAIQTAQNEYQIATRNIIELTRTTREDDPRFKSAIRAVDETRSNLLQAQREHKATTMYAPFSGTLGQFHLNAGNYVNKGQLITELIATDNIELHFSAPAQILSEHRQALSLNSDLVVTSIATEEGKYIDGQLKYIDAKLADQAKELNAFAVFDNRNGTHLIGSSASFFLNSPKKVPQLFVPAASVHTQDGTPTLFVLDEKRVVRAKQVTIANIKESYTGYIPIQSGIAPNDFVVMTPKAPELVGKKIDPMIHLVNQINEVLKRKS